MSTFRPPKAGLRIKVLQVLPYLEAAGTERHVLALSQGLVAQGHQVWLAAPEGPLGPAFTDLGIRHLTFPRFSGNPAPAVRGLAQAVTQSLNWGVDVIHTHAGVEVLYGVHRALRRARQAKPIIFTVHSYFGQRPALDYYLAARLGARWAFRVIAVSHADARTLRGYDRRLGGRLKVIHNGMPDVEPMCADEIAQLRQALLREHAVDTQLPICLVVGRLTAQKGIDVLLDALALYQGPPTCVVVVGDGGLREPLLAQATRLGLAGTNRPAKVQVVFLGARNDVANLLQTASLFILPSRMEGLSLALVEAHAAGLPCLVTNVGGNAEIVAPGATGTIIPAEEPAALAQSLTTMLANPDMLRHQGLAARRRYEDGFTMERMLGDTLAMYKQALAGGCRRG